jgi:MtN3 and saliva related transmembrane protein
MNPEWIGSLAAIFTTAAYIPQLIKVMRHKHTQSISLGMYVLISCGIACWLVYGLMIGSFSVIVANGVTLVMALVILAMKIRHG